MRSTSGESRGSSRAPTCRAAPLAETPASTWLADSALAFSQRLMMDFALPLPQALRRRFRQPRSRKASGRLFSLFLGMHMTQPISICSSVNPRMTHNLLCLVVSTAYPVRYFHVVHLTCLYHLNLCCVPSRPYDQSSERQASSTAGVVADDAVRREK